MLCSDLLHAHFRCCQLHIISPFQTAFTEIDKYRQVIEDVRRILKNLKDEVEKSHKEYQIASTVSDGASIAGSVATVAGILLMPFTAGLSGALAAGGLAATIGGGVGSVATNIINANEIK